MGFGVVLEKPEEVVFITEVVEEIVEKVVEVVEAVEAGVVAGLGGAVIGTLLRGFRLAVLSEVRESGRCRSAE